MALGWAGLRRSVQLKCWEALGHSLPLALVPNFLSSDFRAHRSKVVYHMILGESKFQTIVVCMGGVHATNKTGSSSDDWIY
jgi:hypothetical protein